MVNQKNIVMKICTVLKAKPLGTLEREMCNSMCLYNPRVFFLVCRDYFIDDSKLNIIDVYYVC